MVIGQDHNGRGSSEWTVRRRRVSEDSATGESGADVAADLKKKRATYRGKITRAINRVRRYIEKGAESRKKIEKEFTQIQRDFDLAREYDAEMYAYTDESQTSNMDDWEDELVNDFYEIEAAVEEYLRSFSDSSSAEPKSLNKKQIPSHLSNNEAIATSVPEETLPSTSAEIFHIESETENNVNTVISNGDNSNTPHDSSNNVSNEFHQNSETDLLMHTENQGNSSQLVNSSDYILSSPHTFDSWIDDLIEFQETVLPNSISEMSIAQALYKLEASKDIPSIELIEYDGNPLTYVEFFERFRLHIHDKPHLNDNVPMVQLKMHLTGRASRAVSGLVSSKKVQPTTAQQPNKEDALPTSTEINLDKQNGIKALGVSWNPRSDAIHFQIQLKKTSPYTKRSALSNIARIFDPLGLATAVTIKARIALQEVWKMKKYDWDDPLPKELQEVWETIFEEMESLATIDFPRCLKPDDSTGPPQLHVFSDANILAYGAAAYLRWPRPNSAEVRLVAAKARVAPIRQTTVPRLELMAALLASRLAKTIYDEFKIKPSKVVFWTDSMIVLAWIKAESSALKPFVGVRVSEIQTSWDQCCWRFVSTDLNPADDLSRGIPVQKLNERWMRGPAFLRDHPDQWPSHPNDEQAELSEVKNPKSILFLQRPTTEHPIIDPSRFSNWGKLCRITAY